jgi:hypothetical protein
MVFRTVWLPSRWPGGKSGAWNGMQRARPSEDDPASPGVFTLIEQLRKSRPGEFF